MTGLYSKAAIAQINETAICLDCFYAGAQRPPKKPIENFAIFAPWRAKALMIWNKSSQFVKDFSHTKAEKSQRKSVKIFIVKKTINRMSYDRK